MDNKRVLRAIMHQDNSKLDPYKLVVHSVMNYAFSKLPETQVVTDILDYHGYDYTPFVDPLWRGWSSKLKHLIDVVMTGMTGDATHLMFIDARDVVVLADEDKVMRRYFAFDHPWVYIAEPFIWSPDSFQPEDYPTPDCRYRYLNAGASIGEIKHMREWIGRWTKDGMPTNLPRGDQDWIAARFIEGFPDAIILDYDCRLFQCLCGSDNDVMIAPGMAHNTITGSHPFIIHHNGGTNIMDTADKKADGRNRRILWEHWL